MLDRYTTFERSWEQEALENSRDLVFRITFRDIETILELGRANHTRFEFQAYDVSHLNNLAHSPSGGSQMGPRSSSRPSDSRAGSARTPRTCCTCGAPPIAAGVTGLSLVDPPRRSPADPARDDGRDDGSHVRVGLEDSLWLAPGRLAETNAQQVRKIRTIEALDRPIASSAVALDARA